MDALVLRYVQVACMAFLFDIRVKCDQHVPANSTEWLEQLQTTACAAACLHENPQTTITACYEDCARQQQLNANNASDYAFARPSTQAPHRAPIEVRVQQLCREDKSMVLQLQLNDTDIDRYVGFDQGSTNPSAIRPLIIFRLNEKGDLPFKTVAYITNNSTIDITDLQPRTEYNVSATLVYADLSYAEATNGGVIYSTQVRGNAVPSPVRRVSIGQFEANADGTGLDVDVFWQPGDDRGCSYKVIDAQNDSLLHDLRVYYVRERTHNFSYRITDLLFGMSYQVGVVGVPRLTKTEDSNTWTTWIPDGVTTPTCQQFHHNNMSLCDPYIPDGLNSSVQLHPADQQVRLTVGWMRPAIDPGYYAVKVADDHDNSYSVNCSGDAISTSFGDKMLQLHGHIVVRVTAFSADGQRWSGNILRLNLTEQYREAALRHAAMVRLVIGVATAVGVAMLVLMVLVWRRFERVKQERIRRNQYFNVLDTTAPGEPPVRGTRDDSALQQQIESLQLDIDAAMAGTLSSCCEVDTSRIRFVCVIGHGAFGLVRRATLQPEGRTVAVKTLRSAQSIDEMRSFYREIEVMKSVEPHRNIVGLVGHCTRNVRDMMLLTEYCDEGNLQTFLHRVYDRLQKMGAGGEAAVQMAVMTQTCDDEKQQHQKATTLNSYNFVKSLSDKQSVIDKDVVAGDQHQQTQHWHTNNNNLVVNQMYDDNAVGGGSSPSVVVVPSLRHHNQQQCKSPVEIVSDQDSGVDTDESIGAVSVRVHDCDCDHSSAKTPAAQLTEVGFVDNPSYMLQTTSAACWTLDGKPPASPQGKAPAVQPPISEEDTSSLRPHIIEITSRDLLSFAAQIADGMRFLASQKVVHRDLAARNVLVCSDKTVKISDFGLSRDVYEDNVYNKIGDGKLPIKWMAIESLTRNTYTSQSDVWSFGVLLYEVVTLGSTPYPAIQCNDQLVKFLASGQRMACPTTCSAELYALMVQCWRQAAEERPRFEEVHDVLGGMLAEADVSDVEHVRMRCGRRGASDEAETAMDLKRQQPTKVVLAAVESGGCDSTEYMTPLSM